MKHLSEQSFRYSEPTSQIIEKIGTFIQTHYRTHITLTCKHRPRKPHLSYSCRDPHLLWKRKPSIWNCNTKKVSRTNKRPKSNKTLSNARKKLIETQAMYKRIRTTYFVRVETYSKQTIMSLYASNGKTIRKPEKNWNRSSKDHPA